MPFPSVRARTLGDLLAREEITDVIKRLARATDRMDAEVIASCYHADGYDDHNWFRGTGTEFAEWVATVMTRWEATMHFIGAPNFRAMEAGVAQVDTYCIAHHIAPSGKDASKKDMALGLRYVDRFERRAGVWLIAKRVCAFDFTYTVPFDPARSFQYEEGAVLGARNDTDITYSEL